MAKQYGDAQVLVWRRSYDTPPPALEAGDPRSERGDIRYAGLDPEQIPLTECLKDTVARVLPFWNERIAPAMRSGQRVMVAAHGNSIRALVKYLDGISDDDIVGLNIPNGIPLVYELDDDLKPLRHYYLGDAEAAAKAAAAVASQGKGLTEAACRRPCRGGLPSRETPRGAPRCAKSPAGAELRRACPFQGVYIGPRTGKGVFRMGHKLKIAGWVSVGVVAGALTTVSPADRRPRSHGSASPRGNPAALRGLRPRQDRLRRARGRQEAHHRRHLRHGVQPRSSFPVLRQEVLQGIPRGHHRPLRRRGHRDHPGRRPDQDRLAHRRLSGFPCGPEDQRPHHQDRRHGREGGSPSTKP